MEKAKTFPLREFYVGLRWVRVVKRATDNFRQELTNVYDIFDMVDMSQKPKVTNISVTGEKHCKYSNHKNKKITCFKCQVL